MSAASLWDVRSGCTARCAAHSVPRVPLGESVRRCAAFARVAGRALADGGRLAEPARLRAYAGELLRAIGVRLVVGCPPAAGDPTGPGGLLGTGIPSLRVNGPEAVDSGVAGGGALGGGVAGGGALGGGAVDSGALGEAADRAAGGVPRPGTLVVANHISWLDVLALLAVEPVTVLAKREVAGWPVVGAMAVRAGTCFIDRAGPHQLPHAVREVAALLSSGRSVMAFPQATTWCSASHGTFRRATFQAAVDAGAPVRPVTLSYEQRGLPTTVAGFLGDETFVSSLRRVAAARELTVRVTVHPPLWPLPGVHDRRTLAALSQEAVLGRRPALRNTPPHARNPQRS
ncbi:lysophospholipid acyltransferase family protein [Streptomyces sp. MST-110588]|uniref:lysophospholipid acyltransferase family protein n=1 Tax=Streptomyces sp. MST-110588 TaxID=2833628 RepID=UPI001F5D5A61|nr:lysophospholipid acyltransferase family protein [Streptomyces sp. MST-110588]UNO42463.1 1-acyl-sn-glycerol-3-phosphate acyltransferase [Streptomyces sp. MST-110588]